ncbi:MAG: hypothetical protein NTV58_15080 [Deltaproteobacteria bacterium]|nr:hypothetical protein [Deltaproteobacteria bacterium]
MPVAKPKKASMGKKPKPARITVSAIKEIARVFTAIAKKKASDRREAERTLTPKFLKKLEKLSPEDLAQLGNKFKKDGGGGFTAEDLRNFDDARKRATQEYSAGTAGVPLYKLLSASTAVDKARASKLTNAVMHRIRVNELFFQVTAGKEWGCKAGGYHQVRIRLEEWTSHLTSAKSYPAAVKKAAEGRLSFDCNCERHQFWYRYLATIGGYALSPKETSFPKIRNPGLDGCCCKHAIKALYALRSPMIQRMLVREMEKQAGTVGYGDDKKRARNLTEEELNQAARAKKKDMTDEAIQKAIEKAKEIAQGIDEKKATKEAQKARSTKRTKEQEKMEKLHEEKETERIQKETYRAIAAKEHARVQELERLTRVQAIATKMAGDVMKAIYVDKKDRVSAVADYAAKHKIPIADANEAAGMLNI